MWGRRRLSASLLLGVVGCLWFSASASASGGLGGNDDSNVDLTSTSDFSSLGDVTGEIEAAAPEDVVGETGGTFAFPVDITVYGRPMLQKPADATAWDEYCFVLSYSTAHVDEVDAKQQDAYGGFELREDREYLEPARRAHARAMERWRAEVARIDAENREREAAGEPLRGYPSRPEPPSFPLDVCEGESAMVPDFTPAFDAAAELLRSIDLAAPRIAPGRGITGVAAYLETQRPMTVTEAETTFPDLGDDLSGDWRSPTPIPGTVAFEGAGTFTVDWGDGTVTGPFDTPGVAYGDASAPAITHTYATAADHTVTVTDAWRVSMRVTFLGEEFIFTHERVLAPQTLAFPVGEVRSVRDR